jgi:hypothetical protein
LLQLARELMRLQMKIHLLRVLQELPLCHLLLQLVQELTRLQMKIHLLQELPHYHLSLFQELESIHHLQMKNHLLLDLELEPLLLEPRH